MCVLQFFSASKTNRKQFQFLLMSFHILCSAKIVRHMKARHMDGMDHPLTLEEVLDETNQLDVTGATKMWLSTEALGKIIISID